MTSVSPSSTEEIVRETVEAAPSGWQLWLQRGLATLERLADWANPILVKETRQALKSRQFVVVFLVVLVACWIASFAVVAIIGPDVYFVAAGTEMLIVYGVILAFPLMLIVPFTAFRSLASESEDNTYDLLSITTLSTGQIITGKLLSAIVQMLVFLSAVSPCIAFTFLLRGVDVLTVAMLLFYLILASLGLSMLALLIGTIAKLRYVQVLLSVILVSLLGGSFVASIPTIGVFVSESYSFLRDDWFWLSNLAFLTLYVTTFALLHAAASAQIAFNSENRSTPLRRLMLLQQACFIGWMAVPVVIYGIDELDEVLLITAIFSGVYWYVMGTLLTSEWPHLSRRVQRNLPQSQLGRTFLTWLNPGPGTGYMFCIANVSMLLAAGLSALYFSGISGSRWLNSDQIFFFYTLGWSYVVLYLGVGRLLITLARRFVFVTLTAGFLLHIVLLLVGVAGPLLFVFAFYSTRFNESYSLLHITNPLWTLVELLDNGTAAIDAWTVQLLIGAAALIVLLLNIRATAVEIQYDRRSLPERVVEDEAALHPEPEPEPTNPWEAEEAAS